MGTSDGMAYVGIAPCGCVHFAVVEERAAEFASDIASCIRDGLRIERVTNQWVREQSRWSCDACKIPVQTEIAL